MTQISVLPDANSCLAIEPIQSIYRLYEYDVFFGSIDIDIASLFRSLYGIAP
jgi:hypothetical protein